jgi:N-acetyl-gamma-glutamyl-phosphate reductase
MTHRVFIDGGAGTTGLEIADRLSRRDAFRLHILEGDARKDPQARRAALNEADFAILCLPDDAAREAVSLIDPDSGTRVIDASSAHRTADGWAYGFPELVGIDLIADSRLVANPGCYPTGFLALVAPLVRAGLLPADWPYTVNAVSGYSGGGKSLIARFAQEGDIAFRAYGLAMGHKHLPEMQKHAGLLHAPLFAPAVIAAHRGMIVEVPLPIGAMGVSAKPADLAEALADFAQSSPLLAMGEVEDGELLLRKGASAWDGMELFVLPSADGSQVRLIARLDNLGKGASGAAIQNLNLMAGLPPADGLAL